MAHFTIPRDTSGALREKVTDYSDIEKGHVFEIDVPAEGTVLALKVGNARGVVLFLIHASGIEAFDMYCDSMARYPIVADHGKLIEITTKT